MYVIIETDFGYKIQPKGSRDVKCRLFFTDYSSKRKCRKFAENLIEKLSDNDTLM